MLTIEGIPFIQGAVVLEPMHLAAIVISLILIAVMAIMVVTRIIDFWRVPVQKTIGIIQEKVFLEPCFSDDMPTHGKGIMRVYNKAEYRIKIKLSLDNKPSVGVIMVKQEVFEAINEGDQIVVNYKKGRNTGELMLLEASLA
ncbi:MAG: hypothetical protein WAV73_00905 [Candidatus Moraniibacteriota bacterium]